MNTSSNFERYRLFDLIEVLVHPEVAQGVRAKVDTELGFYRVGSDPASVADKVHAPQLRRIEIVAEAKVPHYCGDRALFKEGVSADNGGGQVFVHGRGHGGFSMLGAFDDDDDVVFGVQRDASSRVLWKMLENVMKAILLTAELVFVHGVAFREGSSLRIFLGWSGVGKTHFFTHAMQSGLDLVAEDFVVLGLSPPRIMPYLPRIGDFRKVHLYSRTMKSSLSKYVSAHAPRLSRLIAGAERIMGLDPMAIERRELPRPSSLSPIDLEQSTVDVCVINQTHEDRISTQPLSRTDLASCMAALITREMDAYLQRLRQVRYLYPKSTSLESSIQSRINRLTVGLSRHLGTASLLTVPSRFEVEDYYRLLKNAALPGSAEGEGTW